MAGDTSGKTSRTNANMNSTSTQDVWGGQSPYLQNMYQQGQDLSQAFDPNQAAAIQAGQQYAGQVGGQVYDPLVGSYQGAFGAGNPMATASSQLTNPLVSGLTGIMNNQQDPFAAGGNNPLLDQNVAMALEQASQNFSRNVAPSITRDAVAMGQYGGTRGDLALGTAAGDANKQALQQAMAAYQNQYQGDRAANLQSQAQIDATRLGAAGQIQNLMQGNAANVGQGVQTGGQLMNLGMGSSDLYNQLSQIPWQNLQNYQQVLGSPTILGTTTATGRSGSNPVLDTPGNMFESESFSPGSWF